MEGSPVTLKVGPGDLGSKDTSDCSFFFLGKFKVYIYIEDTLWTFTLVPLVSYSHWYLWVTLVDPVMVDLRPPLHR